MFRDNADPESGLQVEFTTNDVADLTGLTLRQLQWLDERNLISPFQKKSHRRSYRLQQVLEILAVDQLRRKGLSLQKVERLIRPLRKATSQNIGSETGQTVLYLLTDGHTIQLIRDTKRLIELFLAGDRGMYLISLTDQLKRIEAYKAKLEAQKER